MTDRERYERFWETAAVRLLHPTQLFVVEALSRIDRPLSPTLLERVSGGTIRLGHFDYHCKRLSTLSLLEVVATKQRRGAWEKFYGLPKSYDLPKLDG